MARWVTWGAALSWLAALGIGCGGLSTEESQQRCDQLRTAVSACMTDASYRACVSCYEECGDDCEPSGACPQTFACAE